MSAGWMDTGSENVFRAVNPATGQELEPAFRSAHPEELEAAVRAAAEAAPVFAGVSGPERAAFLRRLASG